ncbi:F-box DNA helicase 1-like [Haliotis rubra]|uniref:F-box DNA helicase 1-like n=1 Tax=Haliotis rubra TaxID=36100 RepID=UPI001EE5E5C9|nr:F-box DNA helicase 1-like [Haliotis rubra]
MARKRNKSRTLNVSSGNNIENIEGSRSVTDTESQENRLSQTYLETENSTCTFSEQSCVVKGPQESCPRPNETESRKHVDCLSGYHQSLEVLATDENSRSASVGALSLNTRKRKIHLSTADCLSLTQSSKALSKPFEIPKSNKDPNRGLQPRFRKKSKSVCHPNDIKNIKSDIEHVEVDGCSFPNENVNESTAHSPVKKGPFVESSFEHSVISSLGSSHQQSGFSKASSLISSQPVKTEVIRDQETRQGLHSSSQPSSNFTAASSLLGLTASQLETGGFQSSKGAVNSIYKRRNSKLQRAKDSAGPNQKNISSFFTKTKVHSTSPVKIKMETRNNIEEENEEFVPLTYRSPSKMYSPIKQMSGAIYINDDSSSPQSSQSDNYGQSTKHKFQENTFVKKLFDGQKALAAGQPLPKKRRTDTSRTPQSTVSVCLTNAKPNTSFSTFSSKDSRQTTETIYKQTYGLLGEGSGSAFADVNLQNKTNYFEVLPIDLIEHIFCQLPILDLCLNSNRVCQQWNDIISDRKFVPWKKKYHMLKKGYGNTLAEIKGIMASAGMSLPSMYLKGLIRHMKDFKPVTASNMTKCLKAHPKYGWATALIRERIPECIEREEANPWCVVTALVVISDSLADIQAIIEALTVSLSQCTSMEVLECLYCIATFLYTFRLKAGADVWSGMHYRVFYALYLYENTSVTSHSMLQESMTSANTGQQTIVKYSRGDTLVRLTHEQLRIVKHSPQNGDCVKIVAFAGTGKTTTLVRFTQLRPDKKFLLVVYNKSVREHAMKTFPHNVTCKTGHALAFASVGRRYAARKKLRNLKVYDISQILPSRKGDNLFVRAKFVMETINNFCSSDNDNITSAHVPDSRTDDSGGVVSIDHATKMRYVEDAEYLWKRMKDYDDTRVGMTHDGYLKMYQLYRPKLLEYDMILIDEAQDLTPAVIRIMMNQTQAKILVGDPHQQIYSFRGAVNAMQQITASHTFYLTQSFRFGPEIAQVAASCLEVFKCVRQKTIVGHGKPGTLLLSQAHHKTEMKDNLPVITDRKYQ